MLAPFKVFFHTAWAAEVKCDENNVTVILCMYQQKPCTWKQWNASGHSTKVPIENELVRISKKGYSVFVKS